MSVCAAILAIWLLHPYPAQQTEREKQPAQQYTPANPLVQEQQREPDQRADAKENKQGDGDGFIAKFFQIVRHYDSEIVAISTVVMALFTVGLFFSTHLLWKSGERHSARELRAYVFTTDLNVEEFGSDTKRVEISINVKNSGQTPAHNLEILTRFQFSRMPNPVIQDQFTERSPSQSRGCLPPGGETCVLGVFPNPFTNAQYTQIENGEMAIFVSGRINYVDVFGKAQCTRFRYVSEPLVAPRQIRMVVTPEGNYAS